jgi:hypothetical protein
VNEQAIFHLEWVKSRSGGKPGPPSARAFPETFPACVRRRGIWIRLQTGP